MKPVVRHPLLLCVLLILPVVAHAQFPEDALRYTTPGFGVGSRALGMGNAYIGVASDYSALYWNPAGLAQARHGEFSIGLSNLNKKNQCTFFSTDQAYSSSATNLNAVGLVYPVPTRQGSLVFAFGYNRESVFEGGVSFAGYNPNSSIIQYNTTPLVWAPHGVPYPSDLSGNIAYQLFLADIDTITGKFNSPIMNQVTQTGRVLEDGGLNNWSIGGAVDVAKNVSLGATVTWISGSYRYDRDYEESDTKKIHSSYPFDFDRLTLKEFVDADVTGFGAKFGLMYRLPDWVRLGLTVKPPTSIHVRENFGSFSQSYFDNGDIRPAAGPFEMNGVSEYSVHSPWAFGAGASIVLGNWLLSGDIDYTDWTQLEFDDANAEVLDWNGEMKTLFRAVPNYRVGAEWDAFDIGVRVRGGFIYNTSPYEGDPASFDQKYITGGIGFQFSGSTMFDVAYARGWWETFRVNYDNTSKTYEQITTNTIIATFTYRF